MLDIHSHILPAVDDGAKDIDEAINHINNFSSGHSEAILTKSYESSQKFLQSLQ